MRTQGPVTHPDAVGPADHLCWVYDDAESLPAAAGRFLAGGLARGERLVFVGSDDDVARLRRSPGPLGPLGDLLADGTLVLLPLGQAYAGDGGFAPEQQLDFYDTLTRQALAEGHTGLRVVAELTPLAADPTRHAELVRWEHLADDFMAAGSGMSAMCAYRRDALPAGALADVAGVHPQVHSPSGLAPDVLAPFRVYVDGGRVAVAGSVDAFGADRLRRVLADSPVGGTGTAVLDLGRLEFADAAGCRAFAGWAQQRIAAGGAVAVVDVPPLVARVWGLLGYDRIVTVSPRARA
ncbi:MEDS domain-containing protein [Geodermatophilus sp. SYSU D00079]